mgnify:CR=1 FL=1
MDILILKFLHDFSSKKLNQSRCVDPFIWSRILDYTNKQIKLNEVKKWIYKTILQYQSKH